jgi:hypothetical protein
MLRVADMSGEGVSRNIQVSLKLDNSPRNTTVWSDAASYFIPLSLDGDTRLSLGNTHKANYCHFTTKFSDLSHSKFCYQWHTTRRHAKATPFSRLHVKLYSNFISFITWTVLINRALGINLNLRWIKWQDTGKNYTVRSFIICTLHQI